MALTMLDKHTVNSDRSAWPPEITAEFEREKKNPNPCVGNALVSETDRVRVWTIRLAPGERIGFHRHQLDYFWTAITRGRARSHQQDGSTVEAEYYAGETRHESYRAGEFKIHDLENIGERELVFTTVEFLKSANPPLAVPDKVRLIAA
jgi:quercetin dioxygenase-like cupin family protein